MNTPAKAVRYSGHYPTTMRKIPREAITHISIGNQCNTNNTYINTQDILGYERERVEKCITDFVKHYIKIEQLEIEPGIYETTGSLLVIDQDKIIDNEQTP